jgi:hypothetical protein
LIELRERLAALHQVQALLRVRVTNGQQTESFRAQVVVRGEHMELTGYTPIGTTAVSVVADGDRVKYRDVIHGEEWSGTAADLARKIGFFVPDVSPARMALLLLGYPAVTSVSASATGLASATVGDVAITYDPPSHPPKYVTVVRDAQQVEIAVLEMTAS